jgi:L-serine dehydratase
MSTRSVFDILGPVMIGPSSSHTAGAVRLGLLARAIAGGTPETAHVELHGSFAATGRGHGTDLALVAGLLGMQPDDPRIPSALDAAAAAGMAVTLVDGDLGDAHPNSVRFTLTHEGVTSVVEGSSVGGGEIELTRIGDFEVRANGRLPLLVVEHADRPGEIARVTSSITEDGANIAQMRVSRTRKGAAALMLIETDSPLSDSVVARIADSASVTHVQRIPAI